MVTANTSAGGAMGGEKMKKDDYTGFFPKWMFYLVYIIVISFNIYAFFVGPSDFFGNVLGISFLLFLAFFAGLLQGKG